MKLSKQILGTSLAVLLASCASTPQPDSDSGCLNSNVAKPDGQCEQGLQIDSFPEGYEIDHNAGDKVPVPTNS